LNPHLRELVLHARPHTAEVDRVHAVEDLGRFVGGVTRRNLDAGVVERHIQPAVGVDRGADGCGDAVLVGDVTFDAEDLVAVGGELPATATRASWLMSASTTAAPASANAWTVARPIPELAPVTNATRPVKS
jgi:hypothetical protein